MKIEEDKFEVLKETEKGILIAFFEDEVGDQEAWFPKSKIQISSNVLNIDDEFWDEKKEEIKNPPEEASVLVTVKTSEESGNAWKLVLDYKINSKTSNTWMFVPKSVVMHINETESEKVYKIKLWWWDREIIEVKRKILEYFNKDEEKYSEEEIKFISKIEY